MNCFKYHYFLSIPTVDDQGTNGFEWIFWQSSGSCSHNGGENVCLPGSQRDCTTSFELSLGEDSATFNVAMMYSEQFKEVKVWHTNAVSSHFADGFKDFIGLSTCDGDHPDLYPAVTNCGRAFEFEGTENAWFWFDPFDKRKKPNKWDTSSYDKHEELIKRFI